MKKSFLILLLIVFSSFCSFAQIREKLSPEDWAFYDYYASDPTRLYGTMNAYQIGDTLDTPAPKGYKAFYVSHFGRHGSRYTYAPKVFKYLDDLKAIQSQGLLNEKGDSLVAVYEKFYSIMDGNWGKLTRKGASEHYGIGNRMAKRFPSVWKKHKTINVYSTESHRVMESRDNFILGFNKACPKYQNFKVEVQTPDSRLATRGYYKSSDKKTGRYADSVFHSNNAKLKAILLDDKELAARFFKKGYTPSEKQLSTFRKNFKLLFQREALDEPNLPFVDTLVPFGELLYVTAQDVNHWCCRHGLVADNEGVGAKYQGIGIVHNIVKEADESIADNKLSATFRFSHDSFVLALTCALGLEIYDWTLPTTLAYRSNFLSNVICLAGNIQLIFYRNADNDVLVKILHNEQETLVTGLKPFSGPYYKWDELKKHLEQREKEILARPAVKRK